MHIMFCKIPRRASPHEGLAITQMEIATQATPSGDGPRPHSCTMQR